VTAGLCRKGSTGQRFYGVAIRVAVILQTASDREYAPIARPLQAEPEVAIGLCFETLLIQFASAGRSALL
jgi:hypothetical protein